MENAFEILVIVLSTFLAIFLLLGIIFTIILIKLAKKMTAVMEKTEEAVNNVEIATSFLKNAAGPLAAGKVIMNIFELFTNNKKGRG